MSLTRIQRDAMTRAQNGDWELADAIEVIARAESREFGELMGGIRQGGRLQFLAYGVHHCFEDACEAGTCCCDGDYGFDDEEIHTITTLNGDVVYDKDAPDSPGHPPPSWWRGVDITPFAAREIVASYYAALARPTQQNLIPEYA